MPRDPAVMSVADATALLYRGVSEAAFERNVHALAVAHLWGLRYHSHSSAHSEGGFLDWCFVRPPRVVFAELKVEGQKPTLSRWVTDRRTGRRWWRTGQTDWLRALAACGIETYFWCPSDGKDVATILDTGPEPGMACVARLEKWLAEHPPTEGGRA